MRVERVESWILKRVQDDKKGGQGGLPASDGLGGDPPARRPVCADSGPLLT